MPGLTGLPGKQLFFGQADGVAGEEISASFGEILGMVMGNSETVSVPTVLQGAEDAPAETTDMTADILSQAVQAIMSVTDEDANADTALPEAFSEKGKAAFAASLYKFLVKSKAPDNTADIAADEKPDADLTVTGGEADSLCEDIRKMWKDVPGSEKSLWAELLEKTADAAQESPEDKAFELVSAVVKLCSPKSEKKAKSETDKTDLSAAAMMMQIIQISPETEITEKADASDIAAAVSAAEGEKEHQTVKIAETLRELSPENVTDDAALPEKVTDFIRQMAKELKAEVPAGTENGKIPADVQAVVSDSSEKGADFHTQMFAVGRQSVMARVNRPFDVQSAQEENAGVNAAAILPEVTSSAQISVSDETSALTEETDITEQIISRVMLYTDSGNLPAGSEKELTIRLSPEELGDLEIKIRNTDDGLKIAFAADRSEAARLIGDKASALAEAVAAGGSRLREMTVTEQIVTHESPDAGSYGQYGGEANSAGGRNSGSEGRRFVFWGSDTEGSETDIEQNPQIFYNKEAKLWVSA